METKFDINLSSVDGKENSIQNAHAEPTEWKGYQFFETTEDGTRIRLINHGESASIPAGR